MRQWNTWDTNNIMSFTALSVGFSINIGLKDLAKSRVIREFLIGRAEEDSEKIYPVMRSYDGSYIEYKVEYNSIEFEVKSTVLENEQLVLISPVKHGIKPPIIFVEIGVLWGNSGYVYKNDEKLTGVFDEDEIDVYVIGAYECERNLGINNPYISLNLSEEIGISTGEKHSVEHIKKCLKKAKDKFLKKKEKYGNLKETYLAMEACLAWDTIYEPYNDEICSPVSRVWNTKWGGSILFCWDTFFAAAMIALENKELAYANVFSILNKITHDDFIPGASASSGFTTLDRSQPPVGSMVVLDIYNIYKEKSFVEKCYNSLSKWNEWFEKNRMFFDGTLCWGSNYYEAVMGSAWENIGVHKTFGAALESGLDNSPMYDDVPFNAKTSLMELSDVGLTGLFINDCKCLIELSKILGKDYSIFEIRLKKAEKGLNSLYCEEFGLFLNKRTDTGEFSLEFHPPIFMGSLVMI